MSLLSFWRALVRGTRLAGLSAQRSADTARAAFGERARERDERTGAIAPEEHVAGTATVAPVRAPAPKRLPAPSATHAVAEPADGATRVASRSAEPRVPTAGMRAAALERTLRSLVERLGTEHPDTITARNNLATKYAQMGRRQSAVQQFELALAEAVTVYGEEHPRTEIIRENLAWAYEDAGRPAEAASQWEILLNERESQFGTADADTVEARIRLAVCLRRSGRPEAAVEHYEQAIRDVGSTERREELRLGLSAALSMTGGAAAAIDQLRLVLTARRRRLGKGHLDTLSVHHRLGRAHTQAGRPDEAVDVLREAYRVALNSSGDPEVRRLTMRLRRDLAGAYNAAGRHREANALL